MSVENLYFSQVMLATIANISPATISRLSAKLDMKNIKSEVRQKYDFSQARLILKQAMGNDYLINNKIQVFFNFKGGTGKTTICHQVSVHMALLGFKVLAIDCDPQAHLTYALGVAEEEEKLTLYDVIVNKLPIKETIKNIHPGLDIIPSDLSLTRIELSLSHLTNREKILNKTIEPLKKEYDFIFIDTNPTISILNQNTTYCADMVNIVCETQPFSLKGLEMLIGELKDFAHVMEQKINYRIIPNKYEAKTATSQEVLGILRHDYKDVVMESIIRRSEDMNISAKKRLPVCAFCKKNSIAFEDICDLSLAMLKESAKSDLNLKS